MPKYTVHCHMEEKFHGELEVEASSPREAQEMVENHMKQYIYVYNKKDAVIAKVKEWSNMTIETRQKIADSCYRMCSQEAYKIRLNEVVNQAITKYKNNSENTLHLDQFMI